MKHHGGKYAIERVFRIRKVVRETTIELHRQILSLGLLPGAGERLWIGINADDVGFRMETFGKNSQISRSAADFQDSMTRLNVRLIQKLSMRSFEPQPLRHGIIKREQPLMTKRREIDSLHIFHTHAPLSRDSRRTSSRAEPGNEPVDAISPFTFLLTLAIAFLRSSALSCEQWMISIVSVVPHPYR